MVVPLSAETWTGRQDSPIALAELTHLADKYREKYEAAQRWPHLILEDLINPAFIEAAEDQEIEAALGLEVQHWHRMIKAESAEVSGQAANEILNALCAPEFVTFLEEL